MGMIEEGQAQRQRHVLGIPLAGDGLVIQYHQR